MRNRTWVMGVIIAAAASAQTAEEVRALLKNRIEFGHKAVSLAAGWIDANGAATVVGAAAPGRAVPDGDTVFEIGSITKVFTSLLLADMIERGEVRAGDPVQKYLPADVTVPKFGEREITLLDLSMQVSGLPRLPDNFAPADWSNPYTDYTSARLYDFLRGHRLVRAPGESYEYSNLAVGLLGHALARRAGMSYDELVRTRILVPLKMTSSAFKLTPELKARLTPGHDQALKPVPNWDFDVLAGAGGLHSTVNDMLKFMAAHVGARPSPLDAAMRRMRAQHRATGMPEIEIAMGWHLSTNFGEELWWHNGSTSGYHSFAGFDLKGRRAAVVLAGTAYGIDDIGRHLVNTRYKAPLMQPLPKAVALETATLEEYVGAFELAPGLHMRITREGTRMKEQVTGQGALEIFASEKDEFFLTAVEARITFERDAAGKVSRLVLHQNGRDMPMRKVE